MFERGSEKNHVRLEAMHNLVDALPVTHVSDEAVDFRVAVEECRVLEDVVERRLRAFDDQEIARPEGDGARADFGADRAAAARHENALVPHEALEPPSIDLNRGA